MDDRARVGALLGREPLGRFEVVVRDRSGDPVVVRNDPLLDDGTPMPTRYWLVGAREVRAVSRLESAGGVRAAEAAVDPAAVADAHRRYAAERDAALPPDHAGPRPDGGVGGTRRGIKCLHAHYAWHLAGGDDPVGAWVAAQLGDAVGEPRPPVLGQKIGDGRRRSSDQARGGETTPGTGGTTGESGQGSAGITIELGDEVATVRLPGGAVATLPVGARRLHATVLAGGDPPAPEALTNALGLVADHLDDVEREHPELVGARPVRVVGAEAWHLAAVDAGHPPAGVSHGLDRAAAEDLFRTLATEARADRAHNPALDPARVDTVLAACCAVVAVMRKLQLEEVALEPGASP